MTAFEEMVLRLKQQLNCTSAKDMVIAELLGFKPNAWERRKNKDAFPEKELYGLADKNPELNIDVQYVLTGKHSRPVKKVTDTRMAYLMARKNKQQLELQQKVMSIVLNHEHRESIAGQLDLPKFAAATGKQAGIEALIEKIIESFYQYLESAASIDETCDYIISEGLLDEYSELEQRLEEHKND